MPWTVNGATVANTTVAGHAENWLLDHTVGAALNGILDDARSADTNHDGQMSQAEADAHWGAGNATVVQ